MTDPIAEAAAKIAAQQAEPSMLEKAMDTIHDLEAKVEHLIHPETEAPKVEAPGEALPSGTLPESTPSATTGSVISSESAEVGNVEGAAIASSVAESSTSSAQPLPETSTLSSGQADGRSKDASVGILIIDSLTAVAYYRGGCQVEILSTFNRSRRTKCRQD